METLKTPNSQNNLEKEQSWRNQSLTSDYNNQSVWYWHKKRHIDQWNKIESPEINPYTYGQLFYNKEGKNIQWRKDSLFNKWCWKTGQLHVKELEHSLTPYTKINSKWIKYPNVKPDIINLLEENTGRTLFDINCSIIFLAPSPKAQEIKAK